MMAYFFRKPVLGNGDGFILPHRKQIRAWQRASRRMKWNIPREMFAAVEPPPPLSDQDREEGFVGSVLSYGFGEDGQGNADAVLSGRLAWDYIRKRRRAGTWQCQYIDFEKSDHFRLRPNAPPRPGGFYYAKFRPGDRFIATTVAHFRKNCAGDTGCGPEGVQLLAVTHPHLAEWMNQRRIAFMAMADYDVAPYGYSDFFDALQMFCSNGVLGLGIGNVDHNYPLFGIPTLRFF